MRHFERVRKDAFLPRRQTLESAGYDLHAYGDHTVHPKTALAIPTGITVFIPSDEVLKICPRSSFFRKYLLTDGTIDADYYPNEIFVVLFNMGDEPFQVNHGDRIAQAIFFNYLTTVDDEPVNRERKSGFGSTGVSA